VSYIFDLYKFSTLASMLVGLIQLLYMLRIDRQRHEVYRTTWGTVTMFAFLLLVPVVNLLIAGFWVFSPIWGGIEWLADKMDKPVVRGKQESGNG